MHFKSVWLEKIYSSDFTVCRHSSTILARNVRFTFLTRKILIFTLPSIAGRLCSTKFYKELTHLLPSMQPCGRFWIPFAVFSVPLQHYNDTGCTGLPGNKTCDGGVFPDTISDTKFASLPPTNSGTPPSQLDAPQFSSMWILTPRDSTPPWAQGAVPQTAPTSDGSHTRESQEILPSQLQIWRFPRLPLSGSIIW